MSPDPRSNRTSCGCVAGGCGGLVALFFLLLWLPVYFPGAAGAYTSTCMSRMKQVSSGLLMYAHDFDDRFPTADAWQERSLPYVTDSHAYACPRRPGDAVGYAFNASLSEQPAKAAGEPNRTPMLFESGLGRRNGADRLESFVTPHGSGSGMGVVAFADGHVDLRGTAPAASDGLRRSGH